MKKKKNIDPNKFEDIVYAENVVEFVTVANQYCMFLEQSADFSPKDFAEKSLKISGFLYLKSLMLNKPEYTEGVDYEKFVSETDWINIENSVSEKLGENNNYVDVAEPQNDSESLNMSLSECFADIYQDLKDFTTLYKISGAQSVNEALWECVDNFELIWGPRLLAIIKELHNLVYGNTNFEIEKKSDNEAENLSNDKWIDKFFGN